jgi:hypothetical protein
LDINLPSEADDSRKFLNDIINADKDKEINEYFNEEREHENDKINKRLTSKKYLITENDYSDREERKYINYFK